MNDEKYDDSMIPLKKFGGTSFPRLLVTLALINALSEYEVEARETGSWHSDDTGYDSKSRSRSHAPRSQMPLPILTNKLHDREITTTAPT